MKKELTATVSVITSNGIKPFEELTNDELMQFKKNAAERLSHSMSLYFTQHPEEYKYIKDLSKSAS